jgi:uncharacterized protein (TIGR02466 family)
MMTSEIIFPTPLWSFKYPDTGQLAELCSRVVELRKGDPQGISITNLGGWHSKTNLLDDQAFSPLFQWIAACCQRSFTEIGWDFSVAAPTFNNAWAMVNEPGNSTRAHIHPNSLFSGVIYLKADSESGAIAFLDPRAGAQMLTPPLGDRASEVLGGRVLRQPSPGLLLIFPSWLWHEVEPGPSGSEPRISISFNVGLRKINGPGDAKANDGN